MKRLISMTLLLAVLLSVCCSCGLFPSGGSGDGEEGALPISIKVHYHDDIVRTYTQEDTYEAIQCEQLSPSGKRIVGLFDEDGIQYAGYDCLVQPKKGMPSELYAKYKDVDISYLQLDPFEALDEDPKKISFYSGTTYSFKFDTSLYPEDEEFISACLCNPYADVVISVSFMAKGDTKNYNAFISQLKIKDDVIGEFRRENLGNSYSTYTYSGTVKAKQLMNANYNFGVTLGAKVGVAEYTVKNLKVLFDFAFDE